MRTHVLNANIDTTCVWQVVSATYLVLALPANINLGSEVSHMAFLLK